MGLKITKGDLTVVFPFRSFVSEEKYLTFENGGGRKYIDLTKNINLTSFNKIHCNVNGIIYYLRDRYFNSASEATGNFNNKAYKPSRPITHTVSVPIGSYNKYKIALNGNFDVMGWFDFNNSSYNDNSHFKGNFATPVAPINGSGHGWAGYTVTAVSDPNGFDMSYPIETMNGEINLIGNISDLSSSDKQIFYKQMTNSRGDGVYVNFRIYAKIDNENLIITYGWWLAGYDERCNGNASYSIKIGVTVHE